MARSKRWDSWASPVKARLTRMPAMLLSSSAFISPTVRRIWAKARFIFRFFHTAARTIRGKMAKMIRVRGRLDRERMAKEPMRVTAVMNTSSGPWWVNSLMSWRSPTIRDMMTPVLFRSK